MTNTHTLTRSLTITTALLVLLVLFHLTELSTAVQRGVQTAVGTVQSVLVEQAPAIPACGTDYECEQLDHRNYGYNWTGHDGEEPAQVTTAWSCWVEYKEDGTTEPISGDPALMPAGSDPVPCSAIEPTAEGTTPLADAEWGCFTALGYDTSGDTVWPSEDDLATCRAIAIGQVNGWVPDRV